MAFLILCPWLFPQVPKPEDQRFYSHPQSIHMPNPRLRSEERSIDLITTNVLRNKERQLMQSTQQADFYRDGLGSQAPINSDDLLEKKARFEQTGEINENMVTSNFHFTILNSYHPYAIFPFYIPIIHIPFSYFKFPSSICHFSILYSHYPYSIFLF